MKAHYSVSVACLLSLLAAAGSADVIDNNFGSGDSYDTTTGFPFGRDYFGTHYDLALPFTPVGSDYWLDAAIVSVAYRDTERRFVARVCENNAGAPGTVLESVIATATSSWPGTPVTATFSGTNVLSQGVSYWLWLDGDSTSPYFSGDEYVWMYNSTGDNRAVLQSTNDGATWSPRGGEPTAAFRVEGTAVPEPHTLALFLVPVALKLFFFPGVRRRH